MTDRDPRVVVVGAGAAGLAAAMTLRDAGVDVLCLEARDRVGGRLLSVAGGAGGSLDLGATWFWHGESRVQSLVSRLDLAVFARPPGARVSNPCLDGGRGQGRRPVCRRLLAARWPRGGSLQQGRPAAGAARHVRPVCRPALDGRWHWASTETATDHPGHLSRVPCRPAAEPRPPSSPTVPTPRR